MANTQHFAIGDSVLLRDPSIGTGFDFPGEIIGSDDSFRYDVRIGSGEVINAGVGNLIRARNPWQKIMRAASRGTGLRLTADDVWRLSQDDAIARAAADAEVDA